MIAIFVKGNFSCGIPEWGCNKKLKSMWDYLHLFEKVKGNNCGSDADEAVWNIP